MHEVRASCPYCGVGCGVIIEARDNRIAGVRGDPQHPSNFGKLCPKGQTLHLTATPSVLEHARLKFPQLRTSKDAMHARVTWDDALAYAADRFAQAIEAHGPDSVAFYVSGQLLTEDYYVFNKLARTLAGTNNIDSNSRLCMSSAVVGYKRTLGADAPPCCYEDIEIADCVFVAGANPAVAHPVLFGRLMEARRKRGTRLIVVDPRRTETAAAADLHLAVQPGTDLWLFNAMLAVMLRDGLTDNDFISRYTESFEDVAALARGTSLTEAARATGVAPLDIERAARWFARSPATLSLWCQGLNQSTHGADNNCALIHLHLATGQIGRPGAGPLSLTGQPNAMGGRETGSMATLLPGHRDPANAADRNELARQWGIDALPERPGLTAVELFDACARGDIRALWIACTNPAQSMPDLKRVRAALDRVPFVVLQDAFDNTETARHADLHLPAATFGEREGTSTNSERRVTLSRAAVDAPFEARADWRIAADFALQLADRIAPAKSKLFQWSSADDVFDEYRDLTRGRDLDVSLLDHERLLRDGPTCWPATRNGGTARLYTDLRFATPNGRARFVPFVLRAAADVCNDELPLALTTVRLRDQWHGASRTGMVAVLDLPPATVEMAPATMKELGVGDDDLVELATARGKLLLPARAADTVGIGQASIAMHYGARWLTGAGVDGINALTNAAIDPLSKQPELKFSAASIARVDLAWHAAAIGLAEEPQRLLEVLRFAASTASYAAVGLFGRDEARPGVYLVVAHATRLESLLDAVRSALAFDADAPLLRDAGAGRARCVQLRDGRVQAVLLEGRMRADVAAWSVYRQLIERGTDCSRRSLRELFAPVES